MRIFFKDALLFAVVSIIFALLSCNAVYSQTYTTITDGNWNTASTWQGGSIPPTNTDIPATTIINIRHTVAYNTGNPIKNRGEIRIEPITGTTARLDIPTNTNIDNFSEGKIYIINGSLRQCRFTTCNDGQPYSGNTPGAMKQNGIFKNIGGRNEARRATVEIAQDWTNEGGGTRIIEDSCVQTGQNFSVSNTGTSDTITRSLISIGWHASGNFQLADGSMTFSSARIQLAGTSGSFQLNSGTANGDIDYIALRNNIVPFNGGGQIFASSSLTTTGINLDAYCVVPNSNYIPNGKFIGTRTQTCDRILSCFTETAATASIEGRVTTASGRGIYKAFVELSGGNLEYPVRVTTNGFGWFRFEGTPVGQTYVIAVSSKRYEFSNPVRVLTLQENITGFDFIADGGSNQSEDAPERMK